MSEPHGVVTVMFAIFDDRGRQHLAEAGQKLYIDLHEAEPGSEIVFERVLLVGGGEKGPTVGKPVVAGARVKASVVGHTKGPKIHVQVYKRRKNYKRHMGHRQHYTQIEVKAIEA